VAAHGCGERESHSSSGTRKEVIRDPLLDNMIASEFNVPAH